MEFLFWFTFLAGCAASDYKTGKIPNELPVFFCFCILFFRWLGKTGMLSFQDVKTVCLRLLFGAAAFLILFPLFLFRMMGAGDIKLVMVFITFLGISTGCKILFYGICFAAVFSFFSMVHRKILIQRIYTFVAYCGQTVKTGIIVPYYDEKRDGKAVGICLAPFFMAGFLAYSAGVRGGF